MYKSKTFIEPGLIFVPWIITSKVEGGGKRILKVKEWVSNKNIFTPNKSIESRYSEVNINESYYGIVKFAK